MAALLPLSLDLYKSPLKLLCRVFFNSRNLWRERAKLQALEIERLRLQCKQARQEADLLRGELEACRAEKQPENQPSWNTDSPLFGHQYSARMIALCCQLCLLVGYRATPKVLECISESFNLELKIPSRDAVRKWNCRNGVAILQEPSKADDRIWMIDHSVQLGQMYVLVVLGICRGDLPEDRPLKREDMSVLAVLPTCTRSKEEVSRQVKEVAQIFGTPLAVVCDGACELREAVASLKDVGFTGVCLSDVKHKFANLLKKELGSNECCKSSKLSLVPPLLRFNRRNWSTCCHHAKSRSVDS